MICFGPPACADFPRKKVKRGSPSCCAELFHLWRHLLIDWKPASLSVGDQPLSSQVQHPTSNQPPAFEILHQSFKRDHTQCSTSRKIHQFQLSWITREKPLYSRNLTCPSITSPPIHRLGYSQQNIVVMFSFLTWKLFVLVLSSWSSRVSAGPSLFKHFWWHFCKGSGFRKCNIWNSVLVKKQLAL